MKEINHVCDECGVAANVLTCLKRFKSPPFKLKCEISTYHIGRCDFCGIIKSITSVRDFYFPNFSILEKNWILKLKK